jgi:hypothetical protein
MYISWLTTKEVMPNLQLVAFERIYIPRNNKNIVKVKLNIEPHSLAVWTGNKGFAIEPGNILQLNLVISEIME